MISIFFLTEETEFCNNWSKKNESKKQSRKNGSDKDSENPNPEKKLKASDIFEYEEDPGLKKIRAKVEKREQAKKKRSKAYSKTIGKNKQDTQLLNSGDSNCEEKSKTLKKGKKKSAKTKNDGKQRKMPGFFESSQLSRSSQEIIDLLKSPPEKKDSDSDQEVDPTFMERNDRLDKELEEERNEEIRYQKSRRENAKLRDRIEQEITEPVLQKMFKNNLEYLQVLLDK